MPEFRTSRFPTMGELTRAGERLCEKFRLLQVDSRQTVSLCTSKVFVVRTYTRTRISGFMQKTASFESHKWMKPQTLALQIARSITECRGEGEAFLHPPHFGSALLQVCDASTVGGITCAALKS